MTVAHKQIMNALLAIFNNSFNRSGVKSSARPESENIVRSGVTSFEKKANPTMIIKGIASKKISTANV